MEPYRCVTGWTETDRSSDMPRKHRFESEGLDHLFGRYVGSDRKKIARFEHELAEIEVARRLYELRKQAGLTQAALAKLVGTSTSVISRLENADYRGHSLSMLRRIASALGKRVQITFVDADPKRRAARGRNVRRKRKTQAA
jgi:DNA-binding XRE family transcriptional regulator